MLKKSVIILLVISLFLVSLAVPAFGINIRIDGLADERVWLDGRTQVFVSSSDDSNNAVTFALANVLYDEENHRVYLSLKANVDGVVINPDETTAAPPVMGTTEALGILHGLRISVDNSAFVGVSHEGVEPYNTSLYYIDGAVSEYNSSAFGVELCIGVKLGLHTLQSITVQLVDGNGIPSNAYTLDLPVLPSEETTTAYLPVINETTAGYTENNTTRITTTESTTSEKTTKPQKTTAQKTTAVKTTKEKTTKLRTTKAKTTVKVVTVYVTALEYDDTTVNEATVTEVSSEQLQQEKTYKELKYAAAAGLLILIFGLCVIINMLNDKNKSDKK